MDENLPGRHVGRRLFEIVTFVLAVVAIVFAAVQFRDSRTQLQQSATQLEKSDKQLGRLEEITSSVQTRYVGKFPHNMTEILKVVKNTSDYGELNIMTDFAGYGIYSQNDLYQEYLNALAQKRQKKVTIKMLLYDQKLAEMALRTQFKQSDFFEEQKADFHGFFASHPPVPSDYEHFVSHYWALGKKNQFVFYNHETGKPFVDLKAGFALACRNAGIEGVTWHTLRHTFASRLVARGVDIVTVQQLLGHSSITVTMRYTHTNLDAKRNATQKLEGFGDNLVTPCTKMQQQGSRVSPIMPLKAVASYT